MPTHDPGLAEEMRRAPKGRDQIGVGVGIGIRVERATMLTKLGPRGSAVHGEPGEYWTGRIDPDTETDADPDGEAGEGGSQPRFQRTDYRR